MLRQAQHEMDQVDGVDLVPFAHAGAATRIEAWLERDGSTLWARWLVDVALDQVVLPDPGEPQPRDGLWRTTCFELFVSWGDEAYLEVNAAPNGDWAAYRFDAPREGMAPLVMAAPVITLDAGEEWVSVEATLTLPPECAGRSLSVNLAAVIETTDGALSHWALAHPAGKPDFHDRSCFLLSLAGSSLRWTSASTGCSPTPLCAARWRAGAWHCSPTRPP